MKLKNIKTKFIKYSSTIKTKVIEYISTNRLFITYVILSLIMSIIARGATLGNAFDIKPILVDIALILIIGAFGYLIKPNKQFGYFFTWIIIISLIGLINTIYFKFYDSFVSFGLLSTISQVGDVQGSLIEKLAITDFVYLLFPIFFYYIHYILSLTPYYNLVEKVENGKLMFSRTLIVSAILVAITVITLTGLDYSRLSKQWDREYVVSRFGVIMYQANDLVQSLIPQISSLFGYDEAARVFKEYFENKLIEQESKDLTNEYTNIFEGKNVIFVHMESVQSFFVDLEINDQVITPTLNKLANEGMYFSDFFTQTGSGTSADTEFTLNTSLMPALLGIAFTTYTNREYVSIQTELKNQGYFTFSTHGNKSVMWNRDKMHPVLGYDEMIFKDDFIVTEENSVGLGISDQAYFEQLFPKLEEIEDTYVNYMGTIITLSNHSPFTETTLGTPELYYTYGKLDLTHSFEELNEDTNEVELVTDDYLEGTKLGNYIHSAHYADLALGEFIDAIENSDKFDNTVFVFYGDHDAKLSSSEYEFYYNYDFETGEERDDEDPEYINYGFYEHEINKRTPLIIWTKDEELRKEINTEVTSPMGVYDVMPTIGNMFGFNNLFAMGNDIFETKDENTVIFPNGDFVTSKVYYDNSKSTHYVRKEGIEIEDTYIDEKINYTDQILEISNSILLHDLIRKESQNINGYLEE